MFTCILVWICVIQSAIHLPFAIKNKGKKVLNLTEIMSCANTLKAFVTKAAPAFKGMSYCPTSKAFKPVSLEDYKNKYLVLFFYPLDFTFVCPTEII